MGFEELGLLQSSVHPKTPSKNQLLDTICDDSESLCLQEVHL